MVLGEVQTQPDPTQALQCEGQTAWGEELAGVTYTSQSLPACTEGGWAYHHFQLFPGDMAVWAEDKFPKGAALSSWQPNLTAAAACV